MTNQEFQRIYNEALAAGKAAAAAITPTPMLVQNALGLTDGFDFNRPYSTVLDGACGFAWVDVYKASPMGRNDSPFVKWLREQGIGRYSEYDKSWKIWISDYNQSIARKEAHAFAMAKVFKQYEIKAYANSRLD